MDLQNEAIELQKVFHQDYKTYWEETEAIKAHLEARLKALGLYDVSNWVSAETPPKAGRYLVKTNDRIELAEYDPIYKEWIGNACLGVMKDVKQWAEIPCC